MDVAAYREVFHLNQTQAEIVSRLIPKRQILLKRPDMAKVLNLNVDRKFSAYWLYRQQPAPTTKRNVTHSSAMALKRASKYLQRSHSHEC